MQQIVPHRLELTWEETRIELPGEKTMADMNIRIVRGKEFVIVHMEKEVCQNMREEAGMIGTMIEEQGMIGTMEEEAVMIGTMIEEVDIIDLRDHLTIQGTIDIIITDTIGIEEIELIGEIHCFRINRGMMIDNRREDKNFPQ